MFLVTRSRSSSLKPSLAASSTSSVRSDGAQSSLGGPQAGPLLQLVELGIALGDLGDGQLGVVGGARGRIAQECLPQGGDLVEIELVGVARLRVPRAHRPGWLQSLERGLDLGPVGPRIDPQPRVVVRHHRHVRRHKPRLAPWVLLAGRSLILPH